MYYQHLVFGACCDLLFPNGEGIDMRICLITVIYIINFLGANLDYNMIQIINIY